jgi:predicted TIM-barrel fold metal-dependent hydrolase
MTQPGGRTVADSFPHAPDNAERDSLDDGFSAGWGRHFLPAEEHVIDCHMHIDGKEPWMVRKGLNMLFEGLDAYRLDQVIVVDAGPGSVAWFKQVAETDRRFNFIPWLKPDKPDVEFLRRAKDCGAVGFKLHNHQIWRGLFEPDVWESPEWQAVFAEAEKLDMPCLWHVTQVVGSGLYSGEGLGKPRERAGNAEMMERFLKIVDRFKGITFVGAHVLYVGDETLNELFGAHQNLTVDTSCGYFLRFGDAIHEDDFTPAREFAIKWSDRLLFGTDNRTSAAHSNPTCFEAFRCHLRYLKALRLPQEVLDAICWQNAQRVFGLRECEGWFTATTRP